MTEVAPAKRKSKALPIAFIVIGVLVVIGAAVLFFSMKDASAATVQLIGPEFKQTGGSAHLTEYKLQFAWMGFAVATAVAGFLLFVGAVVQLFRK
jgi:flagellar basal body-associated protein FliL